jgi:hypothetical protein
MHVDMLDIESSICLSSSLQWPSSAATGLAWCHCEPATKNCCWAQCWVPSVGWLKCLQEYTPTDKFVDCHTSFKQDRKNLCFFFWEIKLHSNENIE